MYSIIFFFLRNLASVKIKLEEFEKKHKNLQEYLIASVNLEILDISKNRRINGHCLEFIKHPILKLVVFCI